MMNQISRMAILGFILSLFIQASGQIPVVDISECLQTQSKGVMLSSLAPHVNYIRLQSDQKRALVGRISKLTSNHRSIIIYDDMTNRLMAFSTSGDYLRDIIKYGKGPTEFIGLTSFDILPDNRLAILKNSEVILILDSCFSIKNQFRIKGNASRVKWLTDKSLVLFYPYPDYLYNDGYEITIVDTNGKVLRQSLPNSIKNVDFNHMNPKVYIGKNQEGLYYWSQYRDTIYTITTKMEVKPRLILKQGKNKVPIENFKTGELGRPGYSVVNKYFQTSYFEFRDLAFMGFVNQSKMANVIINLKDGKGFNAYSDIYPDHWQGIINNVDGGSDFWPQQITTNGDMIMIVDPNKLRESFLKNQRSKELNYIPKLQDSVKRHVIDPITLMDNPILLKIEK